MKLLRRGLQPIRYLLRRRLLLEPTPTIRNLLVGRWLPKLLVLSSVCEALAHPLVRIGRLRPSGRAGDGLLLCRREGPGIDLRGLLSRGERGRCLWRLWCLERLWRPRWPFWAHLGACWRGAQLTT
jgi:hypothetical protein